MSESIFVSYRRDDAAAEAHSVLKSIEECVGEDYVFFDTSSISPGESWPDKLRSRIQEAKIVVAVIGTEWVRISDQWGIRRLDDPNDWVRKEIETALTSSAKLLPVLVKGARMPPKEVLPESIRELTSKQAIEIRRDYWDHDLQLLLAQFTDKSDSSVPDNSGTSSFPRSPYLPPDPVDEEKLRSILESELPSWVSTVTPRPALQGKVRVEITREYIFHSFQDAINFMSAVAPGCDIADHHPRWENIWRTLTVFLSTWDGELHNVTDRDVKLARYFDRAYSQFAGAKKDS